MVPMDSRVYVLSTIYYSVWEPHLCTKHNVACLVALTAGGDYKPTPTQCLLNVGPALPALASIHSALVSTSCWRYRHDALNHRPPSVTLAHIQRGAKHDTKTQYWANVGSAS